MRITVPVYSTSVRRTHIEAMTLTTRNNKSFASNPSHPSSTSFSSSSPPTVSSLIMSAHQFLFSSVSWVTVVILIVTLILLTPPAKCFNVAEKQGVAQDVSDVTMENFLTDEDFVEVNDVEAFVEDEDSWIEFSDDGTEAILRDAEQVLMKEYSLDKEKEERGHDTDEGIGEIVSEEVPVANFAEENSDPFASKVLPLVYGRVGANGGKNMNDESVNPTEEDIDEEEDVNPVETDDKGNEIGGVLLVSLGGGEDEVFLVQTASLLKQYGHSVTALFYGDHAREDELPKGMKVLTLPLGVEDPLYPSGIVDGVTPQDGVNVHAGEWVPARVAASRVAACRQLVAASELLTELAERKFSLMVTPLFLQDQCTLALAHRLELPVIGVITTRMGAWWVWNQLGVLPSLATSPAPLATLDQTSLWSRAANLMQHYAYISGVRHMWHVPAQTTVASWATPSLDQLYQALARVVVAWDPLVDSWYPPLPGVIHVGSFASIIGDMTRDVLVPALLNRAGVVVVSAGGRETWVGEEVLKALYAALAPTRYTVLWRTSYAHLVPNRTDQDSKATTAKFVFRDSLPLNQLLGHPRHRVLVSACGESDVMAAVFFGSPVLCLPVTPDQLLAANELKRLGVAEVVEAQHATIDSISSAFQLAAQDKIYRQKARSLAEELHDQDLIPADRLMYHIESVKRRPKSRRFTLPTPSSLPLLQQANADLYCILIIFLATCSGALIVIGIKVGPILLKKEKVKDD
ncbi:UDP-glucuronosyltransferase 3A1-like [Oratosquilla oratoria]|uniref:UDP-glucuronosyltransferase 3A1-like n=1 Tax=Oratosquilla oratoria TaxID=337810 RepID=UPI003F766575